MTHALFVSFLILMIIGTPVGVALGVSAPRHCVVQSGYPIYCVGAPKFL